jgi:hypothetical protein
LASYTFCLLSLCEITIKADLEAVSTEVFQVMSRQYQCMKYLSAGIWLVEVIFALPAGYPPHIWVSAAFMGVCYYFRLPYQVQFIEPLAKRPRRAVIEFRPDADGRIQVSEPMQKYQDEDGDIANEFYVKVGRQMLRVPWEKLTRVA